MGRAICSIQSTEPMLVSSGSILTGTPRKAVSSGSPCPIELIHKINHHGACPRNPDPHSCRQGTPRPVPLPTTEKCQSREDSERWLFGGHPVRTRQVTTTGGWTRYVPLGMFALWSHLERECSAQKHWVTITLNAAPNAKHLAGRLSLSPIECQRLIVRTGTPERGGPLRAMG